MARRLCFFAGPPVCSTDRVFSFSYATGVRSSGVARQCSTQVLRMRGRAGCDCDGDVLGDCLRLPRCGQDVVTPSHFNHGIRIHTAAVWKRRMHGNVISCGRASAHRHFLPPAAASVSTRARAKILLLCNIHRFHAMRFAASLRRSPCPGWRAAHAAAKVPSLRSSAIVGCALSPRQPRNSKAVASTSADHHSSSRRGHRFPRCENT